MKMSLHLSVKPSKKRAESQTAKLQKGDGMNAIVGVKLKEARREKMNENEFELNGRWYAAVDTTGTCEGCAFEGDKTGCDSTPSCSPRRSDGRNVIYVEIPKPEPKTNGDRIRGMSNEQLNNFLRNIACSNNCRPPKEDTCCGVCNTCWLDWLNSPAEEESEGK